LNAAANLKNALQTICREALETSSTSITMDKIPRAADEMESCLWAAATHAEPIRFLLSANPHCKLVEIYWADRIVWFEIEIVGSRVHFHSHHQSWMDRMG